MEIPILHLDNHLLVVTKPAGLLSQGDETGDADLLTLCRDYLKRRFDKPGNVFLGLVHRLDRPASGIMVLARTSKAAARLSDSFRRRVVDKKYVALVEGTLSGAGRCVDFLMKEERRVRIVPEETAGAQRAELAWRAVAHESGLTLVEIELFTGRPHQVRVQLASRSTPLLGDLRYGAARTLDGRNLALHCFRLGFDHPTKDEPVALAALPPDTWPAWTRERVPGLVGAPSPVVDVLRH